MSNSLDLTCIRCAKAFPLTAYARGCDRCLAEGVASNLSVNYVDREVSTPDALPPEPRSMWRYAPLLHARADEAVSLGEGATPLVAVDRLGLGPLWLKDESRNPTWSFKDRLASAAVTMAKKLDARVIASSSSGNAGAASAAYAARAGLPCVIITYAAAAGPLLTQMRANNAMLITVEHSADRWRVLSAAVDRFGWYPTTVYRGPAVGSNPLGVEGYKTIAFEIAESMQWTVPDWCALPVCYCDALYGVWKGFDELHRLGWIDRVPRLVGAEVSGSLTRAMDEALDMPPPMDSAAPSLATSIAAPQATHQGVVALRRSSGRAMKVSDDAIVEWQLKLAQREGIFAEPAAVATLPAIAALRADGTIGRDESVVALLTATGLKDIGAVERELRPVPTVAPDLDSAVRALRENYGFDAAD